MTKPTIVFIPGSFSLPAFYDQILDPVSAKGYEVHALHLPSVGLESGKGRPTPPTSMNDDAAYIAKIVGKLANEGKDVILFPHSYGGGPTSQSLQGLGKEQRKMQGKKGGVIGIAYMTCVVPAVGQSALTVLSEVPEENKVPLKVDENGWMYHDEPEKTAQICFNSLSPAEGTAWVKKFSRHSALSFAGELTYPGYKDVPISWLFCEEDLCVVTSVQRAAIDMIEKESGKKVDVTSVKCDHCPNVSATQETIDWILDVAGKAENW